MSSVLITGGAGFIGTHLAEALAGDGHDVTVLDNLSPQVHREGTPPRYQSDRIRFVKGDVRDMASFTDLISDAEVVYHQAAAVGIGQSMYHIKHYVDTNSGGTAALLDVLVNSEHSVRKLIVASSFSNYGEGSYVCEEHGIMYPALRTSEDISRTHSFEISCPECGRLMQPVAITEGSPLRPTSIYAVTKRDQEELCLLTGKAYGIPTIALRYFCVYGPGQSLSNPYTGVCSIFSSRIQHKKQPVVYEDGNQTRDFTSVHDIVQANLLAMSSHAGDYDVFNVGTGIPTTIRDVAMNIAQMHGSDITPVITHQFRIGDIRHCYADITKISKRLGYTPTILFSKGVEEFVQWSRERDSLDLFDNAEHELSQKKLVHQV